MARYLRGRSAFGNHAIIRLSDLALERRKKLVVETKEDLSLVTDADKDAERLFRDMVETHYGSDGVIGEEFGDTPSQSGFSWEIDPIDFTWGYVHGRDEWSINLSLYDNGEQVAGWVAGPAKGWRMTAINNRLDIFPYETIQRREVPPLHLARIAKLANPQYCRESYIMEQIVKDGALPGGHLPCGSFSFLLAQMAAGIVDGAVLKSRGGFSSYDVSAGAYVLRSAMGVATNLFGEPVKDGSFLIAARSQNLHDKIMDVVREYKFGL